MANKKIHVLQIIDSLDSGGAEKQFLYTINGLNRDCFDISVCLLKETGAYWDLVQKDKLLYHHIPHPNSRPLNKAWQVKKFIAKIQPDIVHSWLADANLLSSMFFFKRYKLIAGVRVSPKAYESDFRGRCIRTFNFDWPNKRADLVCVNSSNVLKDLEALKYPKQKLCYIPNGLNFAEIPQKIEKIDDINFKDKITLVSIGRLHRQKGFVYLISAIKSLVLDYPNIQLLIAGVGPDRNAVQAKIQELDLQQNVILLGFRKDRFAIVKNADIFISSSLYEGMPNAVMEAMALSTPIIATSVDGTKELITDAHNGILVPPQNTEKLVEKIKYLLKNPSKKQQYAKNAYHTIQNFDISHITLKYQELYQSLCGTKNSN